MKNSTKYGFADQITSVWPIFWFKIKIENLENLFNERRVYESVDNMNLS